ncbi:uncharacterized protein LOC129636178 isoform X4 [Bubalus kerabau]|uniref:uncharacterized protein LOC129636178 isoform X4 n=1 Tax=Bubalus carabanensis TaxID=3119969 RepID=UPI00244ECCBB|nr:uncharacterized protein LOC129636178 isoform X4 [Bubalus carabanensis]
MRPGVSHLGGCVTARGPAQGPHLILRLILGASPGVCSELFREEPHSPLLSWDRERCRRWEVSCSGIGTSTPDSADDCVDRWQLSASVFLAEQLAAKRGLGSADRGRTSGMSCTAPGQTGLCDADLMGRQEQEFQSKRNNLGRSHDGGGVGQGEHFLPHKFIKRVFKRRVNSTKQLLNAGRGHQAPRKATQLFERRLWPPHVKS